MSTEVTQLRSLFLVLLGTLVLFGCTDGRVPEPEPVILERPSPPPRTDMVAVSNILFDQQDTEVLSMMTKGGSLYLTGRPFGFSRWDVASNAEEPQLTFAVSDQIDTFAPWGKWVVDWYASGAMSVIGPFALLSGTVGTSVVNIAETHRPQEVRRYPQENEDPFGEEVVQDEAFIYRAMVAHPKLPIVYGFREQDFVYTIAVSSGPRLALIAKEAYGEDVVCCVKGATIWNNKLWVAFRSKLVFFELLPGGRLGPGTTLGSIQAANIASTPRFLYVQHEPTFAQPQGANFPRGIYVFDLNGDNVALLTTDQTQKFAVTQNDSHVIAYNGDLQITVYRIEWR